MACGYVPPKIIISYSNCYLRAYIVASICIFLRIFLPFTHLIIDITIICLNNIVEGSMPENFIFELLNKWYYSIKGLVWGLLVIAFIYTASLFNTISSAVGPKVSIGIGVLSLLVYTIVWYRCNYVYPVNKKRIGVLFSLEYEKDEQRTLIENDIIRPIKDVINGDIIDIIVLKRHLAHRVIETIDKLRNNKKENIKQMDKISDKTKCTFLINIRMKERKMKENAYIIHVDYAIRMPVGYRVSEIIKQDLGCFASVIRVFDFDEVVGFDFTATNISYCIRYIMGLASVLSYIICQDIESLIAASELHKEIFEPIKKDLYLCKNKDLIKHLKDLLAVEYCTIINYYMLNQEYKQAQNLVDEGLDKLPHEFALLCNKSFLSFENNRNVENALSYNDKAKRHANGDLTPTYNRIFLTLYNNDFNQALTLIDSLKGMKCADEERIVKQCIDYSMRIVGCEPDRIQLLFWIGYLKYFKQNKALDALTYFDDFIRLAANGSSYNLLVNRAHKYRMLFRGSERFTSVAEG